MALLPPFFLDTVVAIGIGDDPNNRHWVGTGFIYGDFAGKNDGGTSQYRTWLITNKHVLIGFHKIFVKFNSAQGSDSKDYDISLIARNGRPRWIGHPDENIDVAAISINPKFLREEERRFSYFQSDNHTFTKPQMLAEEITEGDGVFVLGFPMGWVSPERQYVICRGGHIARIRDFLENKATDYLIDATIFPGNSGGPVIIRPSATTIQGTKSVSKACLIGLIKAYMPYRDIAISQQTQKARITFEENSGLAIVEPVDAIIETVKLAEKRIKSRAAYAKRKAKRM